MRYVTSHYKSYHILINLIRINVQKAEYVNSLRLEFKRYVSTFELQNLVNVKGLCAVLCIFCPRNQSFRKTSKNKMKDS